MKLQIFVILNNKVHKTQLLFIFLYITLATIFDLHYDLMMTFEVEPSSQAYILSKI